MYRDFIAWAAESQGKEDTVEAVRNSFSIFDKDGSGMLRVADLKHIMTRIGDVLDQEHLDGFFEELRIRGRVFWSSYIFDLSFLPFK